MNKAPVVGIATNPATGTADTLTRLKAQVTDAGRLDTIANYSWLVTRNGATYFSESGPTASAIAFDATVGGTFLATLTATDNDGASASFTVLIIAGTAGNDTIRITRAQLLAAGATSALVSGFAGNDSIVADPDVTADLILDGGAGNDTLIGALGHDTLIAGGGTNYLFGNAGDDTFLGGGNDRMYGGTGYDRFVVHFSDVQLFDEDGGLVDLSQAEFGVTLDFSRRDGTAQNVGGAGSGNASTLALSGVFTDLVGSQFDDRLSSSTARTSIAAGSGNDQVTVAGEGIAADGGDGNDQITVSGSGAAVMGGAGGDQIAVASGSHSRIDAGSGNDSITLAAGTFDIVASGGAGDDGMSATDARRVTLLGGAGSNGFVLNRVKDGRVVGNAGHVAGDPGLFGAVEADAKSTVSVRESSDIDIFGAAKGQTDVAVVSSSDIDIFGAAAGETTISLDKASSDIDIFGAVAGQMAVTVSSSSDIDIFGAVAGATTVAVDKGSSDIDIFGAVAGAMTVTVQSSTDVDIFGSVAADSPLTVTVKASSDVDIFGVAGKETTVTIQEGSSAIDIFGVAAGAIDVTVQGSSDVDIFGAVGGATTVDVKASSDVDIFGSTAQVTTVTVEQTSSAIDIFGGIAGNTTVDVKASSDIDIFGAAVGNLTVDVKGSSDIDIFGAAKGDNVISVRESSDIDIFGGVGDTVTLVAVVGGRVVGGFGQVGTEPGIAVAVMASSDIDIFGTVGETTSVAVSESSSDIDIFGTATAALDVVVLGSSDVDIFGSVAGTNTIAVVDSADIDIFGGSAADAVAFTRTDGVRAFTGAGNDSVTVHSGSKFEIAADAGLDTFVVNGGDNVFLFGGKDADTVTVFNGTNVFGVGGDDDDLLVAKGGTAVLLFGNRGNNAFEIAGGRDGLAEGSTGVDTFTVTAGRNYSLLGRANADVFNISGGVNIFAYGGQDADTFNVIEAGANPAIDPPSADIFASVAGGEGNDIATVNAKVRVRVAGDQDNDDVTVIAGSQILVLGGTGNDALRNVGTGDNIRLLGGEGNDDLSTTGGTKGLIFGDAGDDIITLDGGIGWYGLGGSGIDKLEIAKGTGNQIYGEAGDDILAISGGTNGLAAGGAGADALKITDGINGILLGEGGNDSLAIFAGTNGIASGGIGNDSLDAHNITGDLYGDDGDDTYTFHGLGLDPADIRARELLVLDTSNFEQPSRGSDTLNLSAFAAGTLDLFQIGRTYDASVGRQAVADGLVLTLFGSFENIVGTPGNDVLSGNSSDNALDGGGGNDTIAGWDGHDTIMGGAGDDRLDGGGGDDVYEFSGANLGTDTVYDDAYDPGTDRLDFANLDAAVSVDLQLTENQVVSSAVAVNLIGLFEDLAGSRFDDTLLGNERANRIVGGAGHDALDGRDGNDIYIFEGRNLGNDVLNESGNGGSDTLHFGRFDAPLVLDLALTTVQNLGAGSKIQLAHSQGFENVIGTGYGDVILGNANDNALVGGGGSDYLDGRTGNNILQGDITQVVFLDFGSYASAGHEYTAEEIGQILANLRRKFAPFNYRFTADRFEAAAWSVLAGGEFVTLQINAGPGGGIGGESNEIDFRNLSRRNLGSVNVNPILGGAGQPAATAANFVALTSSVAAHELGHMAGLRHADAFGPIGTGLFAGVDPERYFPAYVGPSGATETPLHVSASPASLGTTLFDALRPTFFGEREAIKLAFNETGRTVREIGAVAGSHATFAAAESLGNLAGLSVPNLATGASVRFGVHFNVSALAVVGDISLVEGVAEQDVYSFVGKANDLMNFELLSASLRPFRETPFDGTLALYDSAGRLLAFNDDELEGTRDSVLIDVALPRDGVYYLVVSSFFDSVGGRYELFATRFAVGAPASNAGDTFVLAGASDTVIGSAADDTVRIVSTNPEYAYTVDGHGGYDVVDQLANPGAALMADGVELVKDTNAAPYLTGDPIRTVTLAEGATVGGVIAIADPDAATGDDRLTFTSSGAAGFAVDATTGGYSYFGTVPGTVSIAVQGTDVAGASATQTLVFTVTNVAPTIAFGAFGPVSEGGTFVGSGSFADPGATGWTATVDYGDGSGIQALTLTPEKTFALSRSYAESGTYTVTVRVFDGFAMTLRTLDVVVANANPTGTLTGSGAVNEGSTGTVTISNLADASATDLATLLYSYDFDNDGTFDFGGGTYASSVGDTTVEIPASYFAAGPGVRTVRVRILDRDGGSSDAFAAIPILNVAPTVSAGADRSALAGGPVAVAATAADPGHDIVSYAWTVFGGAFSAGPANAPSFTFTPLEAGVYTLRVTVTDADGAAGTDDLTVTVRARPTATLSLTGDFLEGSDVVVALVPGEASPEQLEGYRYSFDFNGDGTFEVVDSPANEATIPANYFADGLLSYTVHGQVKNALGDSSTYAQTFTIGNVAPVPAPIDSQSLSESSLTLNVSGGFADPGADTWTATVNYGDGFGTQPLPLAGKAFTLNHTYADSGTYTVTVTVFDDDGGVGSTTFSVEVSNVAPTAVVTNSGPVDEGAGGATVTVTSADDPSAADRATLRYAYDVDGNGLFDDGFGDGTYANGSTATSVTVPANVLTDGPANRAVKVWVLDKDGGIREYISTIAVRNVAPVVAPIANQALAQSAATLNVSGSFTDPGADTWTATVDYGDGTGSQPLALAGKTFALNHAYASPGIFIVSASVIDDDGDAGTTTFTVYVAADETNAAPTATVTLDTDSPRTNDVLTATATGHDADGQAVRFTYRWFVNGTPVKTTSNTANLTDTLDLSLPVNGNRGDIIRVEVVPNDGVVDGGTATASATVANSAPNAAPDGYATFSDTPFVVPAPGVLGNDRDDDGDPLAAIGFSQPGHGTVTVNADGSFTYTPAAGYAGGDSFTYTVGDGAGGTATATVLLAVADVTPPVLTVPPDMTVEATGTNGATVHFAPATATDSVTPHPTIAYFVGGVPIANGSLFPIGTTVVTAVATDAAGNSSSGTFRVTVTATPPAVVRFLVVFGNGLTYDLATAARLNLPWSIAAIRVQFSRPVFGTAAGLALTGRNGALPVAGFAGNGTDTLTWTLATPISLDRVTAALPTSGPNAVRSVAGAAVGGANASFAFNVVLGDVSGDRKVLSNDLIAIRAMIAAGGYSLFYDLNGDGIVDSRDQAILTGRLGTSV